MRLVCGCGILCLLIVLPVAHSSVGLTHPGARPVYDSVGETDQSTPTGGCEWVQMSELDSLAIPVCIKISHNEQAMELESIVQPVEIKGYDAKTGDAIDMKDKNVKAEYKKAKIVRRYKFLVPVNTELVCACPGSSYEQIQKVEEGITKYIKPTNTIKAKCNNDEIMEAHGQKKVDLGAYECMSDINMDIRDIKDPREEWMCPKPYAWQGIGFDAKLEGTVQRYNLLEICYDKIKKHTIYVEHEWINGASSGLPPSFTWRGEKNGEYDQDWHKGHLAPAGDFNIYELKKFTYFYANAAPQYKTLNSGKWSHQVEINVRKEFSEATIFTGTSYFKFKTGAKKTELKTRNKLVVRKMAKSKLATTDVIEGKPDVFWKIAIGEDKEQKAKVKGYLYSNKIDFYLDRLHRIWRKSKKSVSKGYRLEGRDVKLIADLLKIADGNNNYSGHVDHPSQRIWKYIESFLND